MQTIALLGLGRMGQGIAVRLLESGYNLMVWNRHREKSAYLISKGAQWVDTPLAAANCSSAIISMVADDAASSAIWLGAEGCISQMSEGSVIIECSTISAEQVLRLHTAAKGKGLRYIDCPVTGLPEAAAAGRLTLLVGAGDEDLEFIRPILSAFSTTIRHFGPVGTGTAYKLMINLMGTVQIAALAEGLALAERLGLDRACVIAAIENSAAASPQVIRHVRKMAEHQYDPSPAFTLGLRHKDATYGVSLAAGADSPAPLGEVAAAWFAEASKADPDLDEAAVIQIMLPTL